MKLLNDNVLLLPSESRMRGMFFVPEKYTDGATSCLVISAGEKVNPVIKPGSTVLVLSGNKIRKNNIIDDTKKFICSASNIYGIIIKNKIYSFGRTVIIKRDISDKYKGNIVIPENRRTQSLEGTVLRKGITRQHCKVNGINIGDNIVLKEWQPHMIEITLEDGSFGLIVQESDILYKHED